MLNGLNKEEVIMRRKKYGSNEIELSSNNSLFKYFLIALSDPIIKILLVALMIKTVVLFRHFEWFETIGILIAVLLSTFISTISEYGSNAAFKRMQKEASISKSLVYRDGLITEINSNSLVVDDLMLVKSGMKINADGKVIKGELAVDESLINGETKERVVKPLSNNIVYRGTEAKSGEAIVKVTKVGLNTLYGQVSEELTKNDPTSTLKVRLTGLAKVISRIGYLGAFLVTLSYLFSVIVINNNYDLTLIKATLLDFPLMADYLMYALTLSVTVIVVAVPEGLPMMITLVLSSNMKRMLKKNVLVKKLSGIETAGAINVLLTDKTGTLTIGKLNVSGIYFNQFYENISDIKNEFVRSILYDSLIINNESKMVYDEIVDGNSTDKAILSYANYPVKPYDIINRKLFDSKDKYAICNIKRSNEYIGLIKGASEVILKKSNYCLNEKGNVVSFNNKSVVEKEINNYTKKGIRVVALAYKNKKITLVDDLIFIGFILINDKIKDNTKESIKMINDAGIDIIMITGDSLNTASYIAKELGLLKENDIILSSDEFNHLSDDEIRSNYLHIRIIARANPLDKSRLVRLLQQNDLVVAMTGDGINDAPALKQANVGFAMGSGTEITKDASDIVILDNNLYSITSAILFGRTIFKSIRKFIVFQLTVNMCAIILSIIGPIIGLTEPITIIQMLWLNMIMDALAGLAFAYEKPLSSYMLEKPIKIKDPIINKYMFSEIFFTGIYSAILCLVFLLLPFDISYNTFVTAYFALFIFIDIFNAFNARTDRLNIMAHITNNKIFIIIISFITITQLLIIYFGGDLFRSYGLSFIELLIIILLSMSVIPVDMLRKILIKKRNLKY